MGDQQRRAPRRIAYSSNQRHPAFFDLWLLDITTGEKRCLLEQDSSLFPQQWSPDGSALIVKRLNTELDMDLLLVPLNGDEPRLLTAHSDEASYEYPCFAPDGQSLYVLTNYTRQFVAPARLDLTATDRDNEHVPLTYLVDTRWDAEAGLDLSPDGRMLTWALNEDGRCTQRVAYPAAGDWFERYMG